MWAIEVELTPKPLARTTGIMTELLSPMRYAIGRLPDLAGGPPGGDPAPPRVLGAADRTRLAVRDLPPVRVRTGAGAVSVRSWVRLTVCLWLLRQAVKVVKWLLIVAVAVAAWPVTVVTGAGYAAAWLRGWPPARLRRAAAGRCR